VQRHRARRLHYDLRFEIDGVLASWAVPRGPTLDPGVKRIAVHVEDHPIEYINFEGVIPAGEYGGGDVIVWDTGTWEPHGTDDPAAAVAAGDLHADMHGEKLRGRLVLVRRGDGRSEQDQWLLLHKHDEFAVDGWNPEDHPRSVLSGRTNDEVKAAPDRMWRSDLPASEASVAIDRPARTRSAKTKTAGAKTAGKTAGKTASTRSASTKTAAAKTATKAASGKTASKKGPGKSEPAWTGPSSDQLGALDALGSEGTWAIFGRELRLTNLDKVLFPARRGEKPVTKRELIRYTAQIGTVILPYLAGRALNMHRFPGGAGTNGFWHKQLPDHAPEWIPRWEDPEAERGKTTTYLVVDEPAALIWAANFGALEWHAWTSRTDQPHLPTCALIDLDPGPSTSWEDLVVLARLHRTALEHVGVVAQPKLTGQRGIQIWVPVAPGPSFEETRTWVEQISRAVGEVVPDLVSWKWDVRERGGLARLDYTQNAINKTLVAPYSPRPAAGAPVSAPIDWDELDDPSLRSDSFTIRTVPDRIAERGDLFAPVLNTSQPLPPPQ
jgi:bifunctional non-homologous end joining protein LigD